jgi:bzd-type benzoyl-CoA reductase N subunit
MTQQLDTLREIRARNTTLAFTEERQQAGRCHAPALKAWKQQGKKIIGFQCTYVPEELIHAAGMLPARITGDSRELELSEANSYMYHNCCSFIRSCCELILNGHYNFLDGLVVAATCDPTRRLSDVCLNYKLVPFVHALTVPRKYTEEAHELFLLEVIDLQHTLEESFGVSITDEALRNSIEVYNLSRELFRKLYELKKLHPPALTGAETMEVYNAMFKYPREEFNRILERLVDELSTTKRAVDGKFRLMLSGSPLNNAEFIQTIEDLGAVVVVDEICTGSRYWWESVETNSGLTPIEAISRRYLNNQPCARMMPSEKRFDTVLEMVKDYGVQGVVSQIIRYCVPYAHDQPLLRERLEKHGIPVLELDVEYGMAGMGQIRTRVQAFLEMMEANQVQIETGCS